MSQRCHAVTASGTTLYECSVCKALALRSDDRCPNGCFESFRHAHLEAVLVARVEVDESSTDEVA